jgi:zinc transporter 9
MSSVPAFAGVYQLLLYCAGMFFGSLISGWVLFAVTLSPQKIKQLTIFGIGMLIGTAFIVIIPEGIRSVYSSSSGHKTSIPSPHVHHLSGLANASSHVDIHHLRHGSHAHSHGDGQREGAHEHKGMFSRFVTPSDLHAPSPLMVQATIITPSTLSPEAHSGDHHAHSQKPDTAGHGHEPPGAEYIGIALVLGFIFMLVVERIGGEFGHGHSHGQKRDEEGSALSNCGVCASVLVAPILFIYLFICFS